MTCSSCLVGLVGGLRFSQSNMSQIWGHVGNVEEELVKKEENKLTSIEKGMFDYG